jgi:hypothetical protein
VGLGSGDEHRHLLRLAGEELVAGLLGAREDVVALES